VEQTVFIYALLDPRTNEIRYIGKTTNTEARMRRHLRNSELIKPLHRSRWIKSLVDNGHVPVMRVLETVESQNWQEAERRWISKCRDEGCRLVNMTPGGDGGTLPEWISDSTREKMRLSQTGKKRSAESRAKQSATMRGRKLSDSTCARISQSNKGKGHGDAWRAQHADTMRGRKQSLETIRKKSKFIYVAMSPNGESFETDRFSEFCKQRGLNRTSMIGVAGGYHSRPDHRGWRCKRKRIAEDGDRART
jgi:hypothetical protein